jgi:hypothetical protein
MSKRLGRCILVSTVAAMAVVVGTPVLAASGSVTDTSGKPIAKARVCHFQVETNIEPLCVETDTEGRFEVIDSASMKVRVSAPGFFPQTVAATGHHEIVLERSPSLRVRLVDATTQEPIDEGEVFVIYPSARRKGPFPANRNGVLITRVLDPGQIRVIGRAEGYEESEAVAVELERGQESEATLELEPRSGSDTDE